MKHFMRLFGLSVVLTTLVGCASTGRFSSTNLTNVELSERNFQVIATNVYGEASADYLLGFSFAQGGETQTIALIPIVDSKAPVFWNQTDVSTAFLWFMNVKTPRVNQLSPSKPKTPSSFSQNGLSTSVIADSIDVNVSKTLFPI